MRVKKLLFACLEQVSSLCALFVELQTNPKCLVLGLGDTPFSTLKDGFSRFSSAACQRLLKKDKVEKNEANPSEWIKKISEYFMKGGKSAKNGY